MIWCSDLFEGQNQSDIHCSEDVWDPVTFSLSIEAYFLLQAICSIWEWLQKNSIQNIPLFFSLLTPSRFSSFISHITGGVKCFVKLAISMSLRKKRGSVDRLLHILQLLLYMEKTVSSLMDGHDMSTFLIHEITVLA